MVDNTDISKITNKNFDKSSTLKRNLWYLGWVFILIGVVVELSYISQPKNSELSKYLGIYLGLLIAFILLLAFGWSILRSHFPTKKTFLHPPILIIIWIIVLVVVPGIFSFTNIDDISTKLNISLNYYYFVIGLLTVFIGCFTLLITYIILSKVIIPSRFSMKIAAFKIQKIRLVVILYLLTLITTIALIKFVGIRYGEELSSWGNFSIIRQWIVYFVNLQALFISIVAIKTFQQEINGVWLAVMIIAQIMVSISSGFIKPLYELGILVFLCAIVANVNKKIISIVMLIVLVLTILVMPITDNIRYEFENYSFNPKVISEVFDTTFSSISNTWVKDFLYSIESVEEKIIYRQGLISHTPGIIIQRTPSVFAYEGIEKFFLIPLYVFPRAIWANKPVLSRGVWFGIQYLNEPTSTTTSSAMTIFGEGYIYSGLIGVILVGLFLGIFLVFLFKNTQFLDISPIYISLTPIFLNIEGEFSGMFINLIQQTFITYFVYWLIILISGSRKKG